MPQTKKALNALICDWLLLQLRRKFNRALNESLLCRLSLVSGRDGPTNDRGSVGSDLGLRSEGGDRAAHSPSERAHSTVARRAAVRVLRRCETRLRLAPVIVRAAQGSERGTDVFCHEETKSSFLAHTIIAPFNAHSCVSSSSLDQSKISKPQGWLLESETHITEGFKDGATGRS